MGLVFALGANALPGGLFMSNCKLMLCEMQCEHHGLPVGLYFCTRQACMVSAELWALLTALINIIPRKVLGVPTQCICWQLQWHITGCTPVHIHVHTLIADALTCL